MDINETLTALKYPGGKLPKLAIQNAIDNQKEITPLLIKSLQYSADNIREVAGDSKDYSYIFAIYLLGQFKDPQALKPLIDFFSTKGDIAQKLTGDIITEGLGQLLASVADDNTNAIKELIENPEINHFTRGAGQEALLCLVAWQQISWSETTEYFQELLTSKLEKNPSHAWNYLVEALGRLADHTSWPEIEKAYDQGLISELYIARQTTKEKLAIPLQEKQRLLKTDEGLLPITDMIKEMEKWACFTPEPTNANHKVTRNSPCPCGSGKKFKKCCLYN